MSLNNTNQKVRVRFAPSPTGPLHIGGVRTALYNYLFAKQNGGDFILRIEDTDSQRFVPGAEKYIIEALNWLNISIDEGIGGKDNSTHAPYRQSERKEVYKKYVSQLLNEGKAYIAFDTPEELDEYRKKIDNFQYDASTREGLRNSLTLSEDEVKNLVDNGTQYVVRLKVLPNEDIHVHDLIRGEVIINSNIVDDKVLYKSNDELPTYHLANVVDDHLMEISHVIRGEEWLPSAPLHVLLYRALGWEDTMPQFAHLPLLLKPEGSGKLSKRDGDRLGFPVFPLEWKDPKTGTISSGYRESGYLSDAVINFLALLGWNPGTEQEIFSLDDLVSSFDLKKCSKSGAKFDFEKCKWFNHQYINKMDAKELTTLAKPFISSLDISWDIDKISKAISLIQERITLLSDIPEQLDFFFIAPTDYNEKAARKRWKEDTPSQMQEVLECLKGIDKWESPIIEEKVKDLINQKSYKIGNVLNPLRLSIVGDLKGPHLFDIIEFIGKEESIDRIEKAIQKLS